MSALQHSIQSILDMSSPDISNYCIHRTVQDPLGNSTQKYSTFVTLVHHHIPYIEHRAASAPARTLLLMELWAMVVVMMMTPRASSRLGLGGLQYLFILLDALTLGWPLDENAPCDGM